MLKKSEQTTWQMLLRQQQKDSEGTQEPGSLLKRPQPYLSGMAEMGMWHINIILSF